MRPRLLALGITMAIVIAGGLTRPLTSERPAAPEPRLDALKLTLRTLVTAEEQYYSDRGSYTTEMAALRSHVTLPDSVWVHVIHAGGRSWTAAAYHRGLAGKSCVIYVGLRTDFPTPPVTEKDSTTATAEGMPVCDHP